MAKALRPGVFGSFEEIIYNNTAILQAPHSALLAGGKGPKSTRPVRFTVGPMERWLRLHSRLVPQPQ